MITDGEKYSNIRNKLRTLPVVRSSRDFEAKLFRRIYEIKHHGYHEEKKKTWIGIVGFRDFLKQPVFVPAVALMSLIIVGLVIYLALFYESQRNTFTDEPFSPSREYSVTQLETLKAKIGNLRSVERDISKREDISGNRYSGRDRSPDLESWKFVESIPEAPPVSDEPFMEKDGAEEPAETLSEPKKEKIEIPSMEKLEKKSEDKGILEESKKNAAPSQESEKLDAKGNTGVDSTKIKDTAKTRKSKKKKSNLVPDNPPVQQ